MTKHQPLTEAELAEFIPRQRIVDYIEGFRQQHKLDKAQMNILDWGCGRGGYTLWLREQGYNAYGVDIDAEPVSNGIDLFIKKGYDSTTLSLLDDTGKTIFPDAYFHFTFSNQVFEHVHNMTETAAEIARVTMPGGAGFHTYPAHKSLIEKHLHMPVVHWLPKNPARRYFISGCVLLGIEPHWPELNNIGLVEKARAYFQYSIDKTYYRKHSEIKKLFSHYGFDVDFETLNRGRVKDHAIIGKLVHKKVCRDIIDYLLLTFTVQDLFLRKR
jgi:ubiquinone/menaquinone biosynthesis C-methylase UbiE